MPCYSDRTVCYQQFIAGDSLLGHSTAAIIASIKYCLQGLIASTYVQQVLQAARLAVAKLTCTRFEAQRMGSNVQDCSAGSSCLTVTLMLLEENSVLELLL